MAFSKCQYDKVQPSYGCSLLPKQNTVDKKLKISSQKDTPARLLMLVEMNDGTILIRFLW